MQDLLTLLAAGPFDVNVAPLPNVTTGPDKVQAILTIVFSVFGALALMFFVAGGLRYIASQGDPQQISKAKGTLIYSLVGLLVSISAISIVTFVLGKL